MAKTLEQINQDFYIEWYLAGREAPQSPVWVEPPPVALPTQDKVERWMRELVSSPDLEDAEELLNALPLPDLILAPRLPQGGQPTPEFQLPSEAMRAGSAGQKPNLWRPISNILFYAALIAIVMGAVILGSKSGGSTRFFGYQYFEVLTGSMQSMIPQGSLVITREVPSGEIKAGDVITFLRSDEEKITHQVIEVVPDYNGAGTPGFRTKGTDNPEPDPDIVDVRNVIGVVKAHVGGLGFMLRYIADNIKYVFLAFILIILGSIALRVLLGDRNVKRVNQSGEDCGHINFTTGGRRRAA